MKATHFIVFLAVSASAAASDTIDIKSERALMQPDRTAWAERRYPDLIHPIASAAQRACPAGFEKLREYAAPEGPAGDWYLHFVVRCITPSATPVASAPAEPK